LQEHIKLYLDVKRSGHNAVAKCPFHSDSSPSLYIYPNNYHCFACNAHGNVIDFEMNQKNQTFREAVLELGRQYQIEIILENEDKPNPNHINSNRIFEFGVKVQKYLKGELQRKLNSNTDDILKEYFPNVGFLPNISHLKKWGWKKTIDLSKSIPPQTSFYSFPYETESSGVFGFLFVSFQKKSWDNIPVEEHSFVLILSEQFQPVINFPLARRKITNKSFILVSSIFDACFLIKNNVKNVLITRSLVSDDSIFKYLAKYVSKVYFVVPDSVISAPYSEYIKILVRWVPDNLDEKIKIYKTLSKEDILNWLFNAQQNRFMLKGTRKFNIKQSSQVSLPQQSYEKVFEKTKSFYHRILLEKNNEDALSYLKKRGLDAEDILRWNLGFCPADSVLSRSLLKNNMDISIFLEFSLLRQSKKNGRYYDFFYNRLIIPIMNHSGAYVALGGRVLDDSDKKTPKYVNSVDSILFSKSKILYNYFNATNAIVESGCVIVVEGFMDCITLVKYGVRNTVAVMGTALTADHLESLAKLTKRVILCFDSDIAGQKAVQKSFTPNFKQSNLDLEVLVLPGEKDPDAYIRTYGIHKFNSLLAKFTIPIYAYVLNNLKNISEDFDEFEENLIQVFKYIEFDKRTNLAKNLELFLREKYNLNITRLLPKQQNKVLESKSSISLSTKLSELESSVNSTDWAIYHQIEIKFLFSFFYIPLSSLPDRFKSFFISEVDAEVRTANLTYQAFKNQISQVGQLIINELFLFCNEKKYSSCESLTEVDSLTFSKETQIFIAFLKRNYAVFLKEGLDYMLEHVIQVQSKKLDLNHVWSIKNSPFLKLQRKNIELTKKHNQHEALFLELLTEIEILEIDAQLQICSRSHFNQEISKKFSSLMQERSVRKLLLIGSQS